ncbi:capsule biosynthesis GfcC family protein [Vibrio sp. Isolate31]|uniref:capsule biosynthesis GfcC family protein n=1 Tax=unclassified Vibrio TaxID=2614977 RepID=UPI001EFE248F|nr:MULTISPECIES: capsule biosynthesis GfcC family protein [unclassified Vibrio]MCG9553892.1 capsule biosynthesis GfcC family protein [Vibrio sp. Isolate32]MCG9601193.1 capsule biosynthesis GfcC family protein [Vibrio sp. Isolate31]
MMNYMNHASKMTGSWLPVLRAKLTMRAKLPMKSLLIISAMFSLCTFSYASAASNLNTPAFVDKLGSASSIKTTVELPLQGVTLEYQTSVRLLRVLDDANSSFNTNASSNVNDNSDIGYFPLSAQLFDKTNTQAIETKKRDVFSQLDALVLEEPEAKLVKQQLAAFQYLNRVFIDLDRNAVISQSDKNPLLVSSSPINKQPTSIENTSATQAQTQGFSLYLPQRPTSIQLMGVMKESIIMKLIEHGTLNDYLDALPKGFIGESADKSVAYVIQPDGVVQTIPYSYWNEQPVYLAPGATVFMAFYALPSEYSTLNQNIVDLLRHKVGL